MSWKDIHKEDAVLAMRIMNLSLEVEQLAHRLRVARDSGRKQPLLGPAARSFDRACSALRAILLDAPEGQVPGAWTALPGARVVIDRTGAERQPSTAARTLALLLEERERSFDAREVAEHLGCSEPVARTTLNRLVQSGHARRDEPGRFRAA